jgi:hypothetical protein
MNQLKEVEDLLDSKQFGLLCSMLSELAQQLEKVNIKKKLVVTQLQRPFTQDSTLYLSIEAEKQSNFLELVDCMVRDLNGLEQTIQSLTEGKIYMDRTTTAATSLAMQTSLKSLSSALAKCQCYCESILAEKEDVEWLGLTVLN